MIRPCTDADFGTIKPLSVQRPRRSCEVRPDGRRPAYIKIKARHPLPGVFRDRRPVYVDESFVFCSLREDLLRIVPLLPITQSSRNQFSVGSADSMSGVKAMRVPSGETSSPPAPSRSWRGDCARIGTVHML
jgi:hypothetical protein